MRKTLFILVLCTLMPTAMFCQTGANYTTTSSFNLVDNRGNCIVHNCFLPVSTAQMTDISSGFDGYVVGIGTEGDIWTLPQSTSTVKAAWTLVDSNYHAYGVAVRSQSEYYTLYPYSGDGCAGPLYRIGHWNGTTTTDVNGCLNANSMSITSDDTLFGISGSTIYYSTNPTADESITWKTFPGTGWTQVVGSNADVAYALKGTNIYQLNLTNGTTTQLPGGGYRLTLASDSQVLYVVGGSNTIWSMDLTQSTLKWVQLAGTATGIYGNAQNEIFTTTATNDNHYLSIAVAGSVTISGNYNCGPGGGGCPTGSIHTASATAKFNNGYYGNTQSVSGPPANNLTVTAQDLAGYCDPFFGDPGSTDCMFESSGGSVNCSRMGLIVNQPVSASFTTETETAYTKFVNTGLRGTGGCVGSGPGLVCSYNVAPLCSNTTNPDYRFPGGPPPSAWIRDYDFPAWRSVGECLRVDFSGGHTPWLCQNLILLTIGTTDLSSGICSYNP